MRNIFEAPFIKDITDTTANMYRLGWNERNGGNISMILEEKEIEDYLDINRVIRELPLSVAFPKLAGKYFAITGTGKYFKNIKDNPSLNIGIMRVSEDGSKMYLLWGYDDGGKFTSEITMHLGAHQQRLNTDEKHKVVMHAHPTNLISMTHVHEIDEIKFTKTLWGMCTECIVIFPDGVSVLPWMVSSSDNLGLVSSEKFKDFRVLVWALHGITVTGTSLDEAFGLMETVEKAADIYMHIVNCNAKRSITDDMLRQICKDFHLEVKEGWL